MADNDVYNATDDPRGYILQKVKENLRARKAQGAYPQSDEALLRPEPAPHPSEATGQTDRYIADLKKGWNIENDSYAITSHRKIVGPALVKGRQMVNGEIRRYVYPSIVKQSQFNQNVIRALDEMHARLSAIETAGIDRRVSAIEAKNCDGRLSRVEDRLDKISRSWSSFYNDVIVPSEFERYVSYHKAFLDLVGGQGAAVAGTGKPRLLEIGVGSGTFSVYFSKLGFDVTGLDNNPSVLVNAIVTNSKYEGRARFVLMDAFDASQLKDDSFDVAFSQGTMEHFPDEDIYRLLRNQLRFSKLAAFSVPSKFYPYSEHGDERKLTVEEWGRLLKKGGFNIVSLDYYADRQQIACLVRR